MVGNRTAQIARIIEKRQPLATKVEEVENNLQSLSSALHGLDQHRSQLLSQADDVENQRAFTGNQPHNNPKRNQY
jgi:chromosome segregation ATPase